MDNWHYLTQPQKRRARLIREALQSLGVPAGVSQIANNWEAVNRWYADRTPLADLCRKVGWDPPEILPDPGPGELLATAIEEAMTKEHSLRLDSGRGMRVTHMAANLDVLRDAYNRVRDEMARMSTSRERGLTRL